MQPFPDPSSDQARLMRDGLVAFLGAAGESTDVDLRSIPLISQRKRARTLAELEDAGALTFVRIPDAWNVYTITVLAHPFWALKECQHAAELRRRQLPTKPTTQTQNMGQVRAELIELIRTSAMGEPLNPSSCGPDTTYYAEELNARRSIFLGRLNAFSAPDTKLAVQDALLVNLALIGIGPADDGLQAAAVCWLFEAALPAPA